ncbi:FUSC family protein [Streptomyces smyrnaeus]|uniref:FUSC family protein n=1 Tax=Streptomyces smyrnaeus TaxID=1387713 RepID=UPI00368B8367
MGGRTVRVVGERDTDAARGEPKGPQGDGPKGPRGDGPKGPHGGWARLARWAARAKRPGGPERHALEQVGKGTVAATVSWWIAHDLVGAQTPAFAPFSAVLILQLTVYQSLWQALRYMAAVCAGVAVQSALGFLAGPDLMTFLLVALVSLGLSRWNRLGSQGTQAATAAFFAFSTYSASTSDPQRIQQLSLIIAMVGIGCGVGLLVNVLVFPPIRRRSAEAGIHRLAASLCDLLADMHPALRNAELDEQRTSGWRQRAADLGETAGRSQAALRTAQDSRRYNPRLLLSRRLHHQHFTAYGEILNALERVTYQVASTTRSLHHWPEDEAGDECRDFLKNFAELLEALAAIIDHFGGIDEKQLPHQARELCEAAEAAQHRRVQLIERTRNTSLPLSDPSRPYGILLAEATRLMDEAQYSCDTVQHAAQQSQTPHTCPTSCP